MIVTKVASELNIIATCSCVFLNVSELMYNLLYFSDIYHLLEIIHISDVLISDADLHFLHMKLYSKAIISEL